MAPDEHAPLDGKEQAPADEKAESDDWFKQAKARWERKKAEEQERAAAEEDAPTTPGEPASELTPVEPLEPVPLPLESVLLPTHGERRAKLATLSELPGGMDAAAVAALDEDLRHLAAEAVSSPHRPASLSEIQFVAPDVEEPFEMPRRGGKWKIASAAGIAIALVASVGLILHARSSKPTPTATQQSAAKPLPAMTQHASTEPAPATMGPPQPVAAPAAPEPAEVTQHHHGKHRSKKSAKKAAKVKKPSKRQAVAKSAAHD
jgi:hypothetical protein